MSYIAKILPVDGYRVSLHGNLPVDYAVTLTHLYQPILGAKPVMLYQTLLHEMDFMTDTGVQTHHTLMNYLCLPLDEIYEARVKLEGIGLMQTYKQKTADETTVYYYELQIPFSSHAFFEEPMLSQLLYHHIGKQKFTALKSHYAKRSPQPLGSEITASFNDVFETVRPSKHGTKPTIDDLENVGPNVEEIDFTYLIHVCKQRMLPTHKIFTPVNRRIITQMVTLYQLTSYEIENCLLWALTEENELNVEAFKSACHDLFQASGRNPYIHLHAKEQNLPKKTETADKEMTKEEKLIHELEVMSPQQLLADLSKGNQASAQDMKVIRDVMTSQGLPAPVMNVLIHYVLLQSDMKLSKAYMETIASHWSRANLKTAKEAMAFAKKQQRTNYKPVKSRAKYRQYRQSARVVPDWIKDDHEEQKNNKESISNVNAQKEKDELLAFINQYAGNKKNNYSQG